MAERLQLIGQKVKLYDRKFFGGSTIVRLIECVVDVRGCEFSYPEGPPDPDGHGLQLVRSTGIVKGNKFNASPQTEDLLSIYSDRPLRRTVLIDGNEFNGHGTSNSGNAICLDGPYPPLTRILRNTVNDARCGITIAGGMNHIVEETNKFDDRCGTKLYVAGLADRYPPAPFGPFDLRLPPGDILWGK